MPEEGLLIIEDSLAWTNETGTRFFNTELYHIRAELLLLMYRGEEAEHSYRMALEVAREQKARMWELRAASDLAQLLREQQRQAEARDVLAPVHSGFSEGFDILELQRSKALLMRLSAATAA